MPATQVISTHWSTRRGWISARGYGSRAGRIVVPSVVPVPSSVCSGLGLGLGVGLPTTAGRPRAARGSAVRRRRRRRRPQPACVIPRRAHQRSKLRGLIRGSMIQLTRVPRCSEMSRARMIRPRTQIAKVTTHTATVISANTSVERRSGSVHRAQHDRDREEHHRAAAAACSRHDADAAQPSRRRAVPRCLRSQLVP